MSSYKQISKQGCYGWMKQYIHGMWKITWNNELVYCLQFIWHQIIGLLDWFKWKQACYTSCAQTLPKAIPPIFKIQLFRKYAITFEPNMLFWSPLRFRMSAFATYSIVWLKSLSLTVLVWCRRKAKGVT